MNIKINYSLDDGPDDRQEEYADLIARIQALPEAEPPADFSAQVMSRLPAQRISLLARARVAFQRLRTAQWAFSIAPFKWGAVALGLLAALVLLRFGGLPGVDPDLTSSGPPLDLAEGVDLLESQRFAEAQVWFAQRQGQAAREPALNFYLGRTYLALAQPREALDHFQRALETESPRPEYHFWLGLCHYALKAPDQELAGYQRTLALDPGFLPAHVYAGHHFMERRQWQAALAHYQRVLEALPDHAQALFNSGVALHHIDPGGAENEIWRTFLLHYPTGPQALAAAARLNANGDFSYRSHRLGAQRWVIKTLRFGADPCQLVPEDLAVLQELGARIMPHIPEMVLHLVGYAEGNASLARCRVQQIKGKLMGLYPELPAEHIRLSWFGVPEQVRQGKRLQELKESLQIFTQPVNLNSV
ncbi:MAG: tetratricopeptide repeat protein [Desulfobacterales bacterium]